MSTYPEPKDEIVADLLGQLDDANMLETYEERAGILEFDAGLPRGHAECLALLEIIRRHFILTKRG
jgi:hypothetical protein